MKFISIGIFLIVVLAPYTYFSVKRGIARDNRKPTRSLYLFPIVQVGGGIIVIIAGVFQLVH